MIALAALWIFSSIALLLLDLVGGGDREESTRMGG